ncbi:hypothetical protein ACQ4PT_012048 [Festuca glaucescens]
MVMGGVRQQLLAGAVVLVAVVLMATAVEGYISEKTRAAISRANRHGPFVGLVVPNAYEMVPVLNSPSFVASKTIPNLDVQGTYRPLNHKQIMMIPFAVLPHASNQHEIYADAGGSREFAICSHQAGLTTQMLLSLFRVKGIVHWGIAGNANEDLQIGDVTIPEYWAHLSLWNWQRYGDGKENELPLESAGDYTREYGFLNFSDYTVGQGNPALAANELNSIWYQPEEIFPASGVPEERQHAFWVRASKRYYALAAKLEGLELPACVNGTTTCLPRAPRVVRVSRGCSGNVFLDNARYRQFLRAKFQCTPIEMESAAVALVAYQQGVPFLTIRSLSDLAGGGSALGNEASTFISIAAQNAVDVMLKFVPLLKEQ